MCTEGIQGGLHMPCMGVYALLFRRVMMKDLRIIWVGEVCRNAVGIKVLLSSSIGTLGISASCVGGGRW
jgi:hypothetical protein